MTKLAVIDGKNRLLGPALEIIAGAHYNDLGLVIVSAGIYTPDYNVIDENMRRALVHRGYEIGQYTQEGGYQKGFYPRRATQEFLDSQDILLCPLQVHADAALSEFSGIEKKLFLAYQFGYMIMQDVTDPRDNVANGFFEGEPAGRIVRHFHRLRGKAHHSDEEGKLEVYARVVDEITDLVVNGILPKL